MLQHPCIPCCYSASEILYKKKTLMLQQHKGMLGMYLASRLARNIGHPLKPREQPEHHCLLLQAYSMSRMLTWWCSVTSVVLEVIVLQKKLKRQEREHLETELDYSRYTCSASLQDLNLDPTLWVKCSVCSRCDLCWSHRETLPFCWVRTNMLIQRRWTWAFFPQCCDCTKPICYPVIHVESHLKPMLSSISSIFLYLIICNVPPSAFFFQVLQGASEARTMDTDDHFLRVSKMIMLKMNTSFAQGFSKIGTMQETYVVLIAVLNRLTPVIV